MNKIVVYPNASSDVFLRGDTLYEVILDESSFWDIDKDTGK